jgi:hypothetical protein
MEPRELRPAKIMAECPKCHHLYDLCRNGYVCDACGCTDNPCGARMVSEADANVYGAVARMQLRTAMDKIEKWQSKGLSPYHHELNDSGTACAEHCPACRWVAEQSPKQATSFEQESIDECERIWKLEDNR